MKNKEKPWSLIFLLFVFCGVIYVDDGWDKSVKKFSEMSTVDFPSPFMSPLETESFKVHLMEPG